VRQCIEFETDDGFFVNIIEISGIAMLVTKIDEILKFWFKRFFFKFKLKFFT
jgi:hypothetical protein